MPSLQKLHDEFAGKAVAIVGVNTWERKADAGPKYMAEKKYTYQQLMKGDDLAKAYGITGIPTMILIGKDGKVLHTVTGFGPGEEETLRGKITEALGK
jgi:thiol-disulfide isomerase/thioredoxin